MKNTFRQH